MAIYTYPSAVRRRSRWFSTTKSEYCKQLGVGMAIRRAFEIVGLDTKLWKGARVYRLTCKADFGCGHHDVWEPAAVLWALIGIKGYLCAWHR